MFTAKFLWEAPNDRVGVQFGPLLGQLFHLWERAGPSGGPESHSGDPEEPPGGPESRSGGPWKAIWGPRKPGDGPKGGTWAHRGHVLAIWGPILGSVWALLGRRFWVDV